MKITIFEVTFSFVKLTKANVLILLSLFFCAFMNDKFNGLSIKAKHRLRYNQGLSGLSLKKD